MLIRAFAPDEWRLYRDARLAALLDSPDAFGSTHAESAARGDSAWRDRLRTIDAATDVPIAALRDGEVLGMAWATRASVESEIAHLYQMWVAPNARGEGVGRRILERALDWARTQGVRRMLLAVTIGGASARRLYESIGFRADGEPEPLQPGSALQVQPMALDLDEVSSADV